MELRALYSPDVDFNDVVESSGIVWSTGGDAVWEPTGSRAVSGGDSLKAGTISHNQQTWVEALVYGPGSLTFSWWVSSEFTLDGTADQAWFRVDSVRKQGLGGPNIQWFRETITLEGDGEHTVRWEYERDHAGGGGDNAVWLDAVQWAPSGLVERPPSYSRWAVTSGIWPDARFAQGDSDENGITDIFDYALHLPEQDPWVGMPRIETGGRGRAFIFDLPAGQRPDLVLTIQSTTSLQPVSWRNVAVKRGDADWDVIWTDPQTIVIDGGTRRVRVAAGVSKQFFRLKAELENSIGAR